MPKLAYILRNLDDGTTGPNLHEEGSSFLQRQNFKSDDLRLCSCFLGPYWNRGPEHGLPARLLFQRGLPDRGTVATGRALNGV